MPLDRLTKLDPLQLGRFRILARLGGGGMGNVYLAEADDGTPAAVKVIRADLAQDTQFRARFRREVEAGRRLANRGVARYLDADTYAASPWLATEFVPGPTLHHQVFATGPVVGPRVVGLAAGLADALVAIHAAGLVHRDLKPANILLAPEGPKVIDFGISLAADATALTSTGTMVGSPAYMSPEQAQARKDVGPAADVFSWACCLTFASRRQPPFGEGEAAGLLYRVVHEAPDLDGVPVALLAFVRAALDKEAANRPTAAELVAGMTAVLDGAPAATLVTSAGPGQPWRVTAATAPDAGRVLAATWTPDPRALEEAERMLAEAQGLRAGLPPRAEERRQRERTRANRAVFAAAFVAFLALLLVGFVTIRPGQTDVARALDNGQGPDPEVSSSTSAATVAGEVTTSTSNGASAPTTAGPGPGAAPGTTAPAAVPGGAGAVSPSTLEPPSTPTTAPVAPVATGGPTSCTAELVEPVAGRPVGQLPTATGDTPSYDLRVRLSTSGFPAASLALVRQPPRAGEAWTRAVGAGPSGTVVVGPFAMRQGAGTTTYGARTIHHEAAGTTFELVVRVGGRTLGCGQFLGPP